MASLGSGPTRGPRMTHGSADVARQGSASIAAGGRPQKRRGYEGFALGALVLLTLAVVVGLLDRDDPDLQVAYPRDRDVEAETTSSAAHVAPGPETDPSAPADRGDRALRLPGKLPPLADGTRTGREALRRALAAPGHGHLLIDFAAIGRSPLARKMMKCRGERVDAALARMRDEFGIAVDRDLETIGSGNAVLAFGGRFGALKLPASAGVGVAYGDGARVYELGEGDGGRNYVAVLGEHTVLMANSRAGLEAAVDRFEGRAPAESSRVAKADIEGQMLGEDLAEMLGASEGTSKAPPGSEAPQLDVIRRLVRKVGMRIDVDERAAMSFDIDTDTGKDADEIGAALRGGVAMLRQLARSEGLHELDALLDQARILDPTGGRIGLDLAVPGDWILARMGCAADGTPRQQAAGGDEGSTDPAEPGPQPTAPGAVEHGSTTLEVVRPQEPTP